MFDTESSPASAPSQPDVSDVMSQPQPVMPQMVSPLPPPRKSRAGAVVAMIVFLILLLVSGAAAYFFLIFRNNPEYVLGKSMLAMSELESAAFDVHVQVAGEIHDTKDDDVSPVTVTFQSVGTADFSEGGDFAATASMAANAGGVANIGPYAGEVRQVDEVVYLNLSAFTIPALFPTMDMGKIINVITNRWIEVDAKGIVDMVGAGALLQQLEDAQDEQEVKYEAQLEEAAREYLPTFITVTETLDREQMHGVTTNHFAYVVNEDAMRGFVTRIQEIVGDDFGIKMREQIADVNAILDGVEDLHGEIWIGSADAYLYKITLTGKAALPEGKENAGTLQLTLTASFSEFNEPVAVEVPQDTTSVQVIAEEVMTAVMENAAEAKAVALESDEDADGLSLAKEDRCGTDEKNPDTDGDGFSDGAEVAGGYDPNGPGKIVWPGNMQVTNDCP